MLENKTALILQGVTSQDLLPPDKVLKEWEKDYKDLSESMIYGDKLPWNDLLERIKELTRRIKMLDFRIVI